MSFAGINCALMMVIFVVCYQSSGLAQFSFDDPPINYRQTRATDRVAKLAEKIESGKWRLDAEHDFLPAVLKALDIPVSSQSLVFSKTSLQIHRISPETPRAVYFNDDVYVAWVQDGYMLEIGAMDDKLGGVFYTLDLNRTEPRITRDRGGCNACHASMRTQRVPGFFIRSVYPREDGRPRDIGTVTDHRSDYESRWGGWYVTGKHGAMRHIGNEIASDAAFPEKVDREQGANVTSLDDRIDTRPYLSPHSDLVALLVMEHQMQTHNLITLANYETRKALEIDREAEIATQQPSDAPSAETTKRIAKAGDKLVEYLLFCGEPTLPSPVTGTSEFAAEFAQLGPFDAAGRSLRQFDLQTRLFRYPCSYLIYSSSFNALPELMANYVRDRMLAILRGEETSDRYAHLSSADRCHLLEILAETKPAWFVD